MAWRLEGSVVAHNVIVQCSESECIIRGVVLALQEIVKGNY
jgi:hypothetical protein